MKSDVAQEMHGFDAMLFLYSETFQEWQALRYKRMSDAAAWIAQRRVDPS